jgi:hypothetical protein
VSEKVARLREFVEYTTLLGERDSLPTRFVIDFADNDLLESRGYPVLFARVETRVLPTRRAAARRESDRSREALAADRDAKVNRDHGSALERWQWFVNRCSTLTERFRYTSNRVLDTFAWPQAKTNAQIDAVAEAAVALRTLRRSLMKQHALSLRELYRSLESPGKHPLKDAHTALDRAVRAAYGMGKTKDPLAFLLELNARLAARESAGRTIVGPGWPASAGRKRLVTADCVEWAVSRQPSAKRAPF